MLRSRFTYEAPESLGQAANDLMTRDNITLLAGGTDLIPLIKYGVKKPSCLLDLKRISSLKSVAFRENGLFIGSMVTLSEIVRHPLIHQYLPALAESARRVASPQIRNLATLGGNLLQERRCLYFNQSEYWRKNISPCLKLGGEVCHQAPKSKTCRALYYSDTAPVLLAFDAQAEFEERGGLKVIPLREMVHRHVNNEMERGLLTGIRIPIPLQGTWGAFMKSSLRAAIDFAAVNVAIRFSPASGQTEQVPVLKICVGAIAPEPVMLDETAEHLASNFSNLPSLKEEIKEQALKESSTKSALIRETGISLKSKRNAFHIIPNALDQLFKKLCASPVENG